MTIGRNNNDSPFFQEADVDVTNLKKSLNSAERQYVKCSKAVDRRSVAMDNYLDKSFDTAKQSKEAAKQDEKQQRGREASYKKSSSIILGALKRESGALSNLGLSWSTIAGAAGGGAILGFVGKAISSYLAFDRQTRELNATMSMQPKAFGAASAIIQGYTGYLDISREELVQITKQIGETRTGFEGLGKAAKANLLFTTRETINLSKSMDVSTSAAIDFFDISDRIYKLPHRRLRNIGASMKYIQEMTSISGDELLSFGKSLEDVLSRMLKSSGDTKAGVTADFMALAGVLKDAGIQPEKLATTFGEAMKIHSEQGARFLSLITEDTELSINQVREAMEGGDIKTPMSLLIKKLKKEGPEYLKVNEDWLTEVTGLTFSELRNVQNMSEAGLMDLMAKNRKEYDRGRLAAEAASKRQNRLSMQWNSLKRSLEKVWLGIGGALTSVAAEIADLVIPQLNRLAKWFSDGIKPGGAIPKFISSAKVWFADLWEAVGPVAKKFGTEFIAKMEWLGSEEGGMQLKAWFKDVVNSIGLMAKGIKGIAEFIGEVKQALKTTEQIAYEATHTAMKDAEDRLPRMMDTLNKKMREGDTVNVAGKQILVTPSTLPEIFGKIGGEYIKNLSSQLTSMVASGDIDLEFAKKNLESFKSQWDLQSSLAQQEMLARRHMSAGKEGAAMGGGATGLGVINTTLAKSVPATTVVGAGGVTTTKVEVKTNSEKSEKILEEIRDGIKDMKKRQNQHPSRSVVGHVLGQ